MPSRKNIAHLEMVKMGGINNYRHGMGKMLEEREYFLTVKELEVEHEKWKGVILEKADEKIGNEKKGKRRQWKRGGEREGLIGWIEQEYEHFCQMNELARELGEEREKCTHFGATMDVLLAEMVRAKWEMEEELKIVFLREQINCQKELHQKCLARIGELKRRKMEIAVAANTDKTIPRPNQANNGHLLPSGRPRTLTRDFFSRFFRHKMAH